MFLTSLYAYATMAQTCLGQPLDSAVRHCLSSPYHSVHPLVEVACE
jgi:hypothetical protein